MAAAEGATPPGVDADEVIPLLRAILMILLELRDAEPHPEPTSVQLLTGAGFTYKQIAELTGRSPDAVRMAINRAKKAPAKKVSRGPNSNAAPKPSEGTTNA